MARSVSTIYNEMVTEKQTFSSLKGLVPNPETAATLISELTSNSKVAVWRLFFWVVAFCIHLHEVVWDFFKIEIESILANKEPGTTGWMVSKSLEFQYGDDLEWINNKFQYAIIDESKQIIKVAAGSEGEGIVILKVAKISGDEYVKLESGELDAYSAYIELIKYAGVRVTKISENADEAKIAYQVFYNPLILNSDGSLISDPTIFPVLTAVNTYLKNLPFDGILVLSDLTQIIKGVVGVKDCVLTLAQARHGSDAYADIARTYETYSGYITNATNYPALTYISNE